MCVMECSGTIERKLVLIILPLLTIRMIRQRPCFFNFFVEAVHGA